MNRFYFLYLFLLCHYATVIKSEDVILEQKPDKIHPVIIEKNRKRLRAQAHQIEEFIALCEKLYNFFSDTFVGEKIKENEFKNRTDRLIQFLKDMLYLTKSKKVYLKTSPHEVRTLLNQLMNVVNLAEQTNILLIEKKDIDFIENRTLDIIDGIYLLYLKKTVRRMYEVEIECIKMKEPLSENDDQSDLIIKSRSRVMLTHHKIKTGYNNLLVYLSFEELWQQIMNEIYSSFDKEYSIGEIIVFCAEKTGMRENLELLEKSDNFILPLNNKAFIALGALYPFLETAPIEISENNIEALANNDEIMLERPNTLIV
jgi:hypothetical protein